MNEAFLHYVWQTSHFDQNQLKTHCGKTITILKPGFPHRDSGPDYSHASLIINDLHWVGHVEIHLKSSYWLQHQHHLDKAYDQTILHVVYENDRSIFRSDGSEIPCLVLKGRIPENLIHQYDLLISNSHRIPCQALVEETPPELKTLCIERMTIDRLSDKSIEIKESLTQLNNDWSEVLYREICRAFGLRINKLPFELLAKELPLRLLLKYGNRPLALEALLFGTAGFLQSNARDPYEKQLATEYQFLRGKHNLTPIEPHLWKFHRLRPANFPTIRLAQLAGLLVKSPRLFSMLKDDVSYRSWSTLFQVKTSAYWLNHFTFGSVSVSRKKKLGRSTVDLILINAIIPVMYSYSEYTHDSNLSEATLSVFAQIEPEKNRVTRFFHSLKFPMDNAFQSQGILQLHNKFCTFQKCLNCPIGHTILSNRTNEAEV